MNKETIYLDILEVSKGDRTRKSDHKRYLLKLLKKYESVSYIKFRVNSELYHDDLKHFDEFYHNEIDGYVNNLNRKIIEIQDLKKSYWREQDVIQEKINNCNDEEEKSSWRKKFKEVLNSSYNDEKLKMFEEKDFVLSCKDEKILVKNFKLFSRHNNFRKKILLKFYEESSQSVKNQIENQVDEDLYLSIVNTNYTNSYYLNIKKNKIIPENSKLLELIFHGQYQNNFLVLDILFADYMLENRNSVTEILRLYENFSLANFANKIFVVHGYEDILELADRISFSIVVLSNDEFYKFILTEILEYTIVNDRRFHLKIVKSLPSKYLSFYYERYKDHEFISWVLMSRRDFFNMKENLEMFIKCKDYINNENTWSILKTVMVKLKPENSSLWNGFVEIIKVLVEVKFNFGTRFTCIVGDKQVKGMNLVEILSFVGHVEAVNFMKEQGLAYQQK